MDILSNIMLTHNSNTSNIARKSQKSDIKGKVNLKKSESSDIASKKRNKLSSNKKTNCQGKEDFETVYSNTRLNLTDSPKRPDTKGDWLSFCGSKITEQNYKKIIELFLEGKFFNEIFEIKEYGSHFSIFKGGTPFDTTVKNQIGVNLASRYSEEFNNYDVQLKISGSVLEELVKLNDLMTVARIITQVKKLGLHITRIDLAINDYEKRLEIDTLLDYCLQGYLCNFQKFNYNVSLDVNKKYLSKTIYFGSRQSNKYMRVYDTFVLHGYHANRWELELKNQTARLVQDVFINAVESYDKELTELKDKKQTIDYIALEKKYNNSLIEYTHNIILSSVDFKDKSQVGSNGNIGKFASIENYQKFKKYINEDYQKITLKTEVKKTDLKGKFNWFFKSGKAFLSVVEQGLGIQDYRIIDRLFRIADKAKVKPEVIQKDNELMIAELQRNGFNALMTNEQIKQFSDEYGIDFGFMHSELHHEDKWQKRIKSKQFQMAQFNKPSDIFSKLLKTDITGLYWIFENLPSEFENIIKHFKPIERQELIECYSTYS